MNILETKLTKRAMKLKLKELIIGKWTVLYVYPGNNTPGCTVDAGDFSELLFGIRGLDNWSE